MRQKLDPGDVKGEELRVRVGKDFLKEMDDYISAWAMLGREMNRSSLMREATLVRMRTDPAPGPKLTGSYAKSTVILDKPKRVRKVRTLPSYTGGGQG